MVKTPEEFDLANPHAKAERDLVDAWVLGLKPEARMSLSEWADTYRVLSPLASAEHGAWRTSRVPYMREPMDCLSPGSTINEVALMFGAQLSKTEFGLNWLGQIVDQAPGPTMYVMPTVDQAKKASRQRVDPLFEETPQLSHKLRDRRQKDSGNNRLEKLFPGGLLIMTGANSASGLRAHPVRYLFLDEIDAYPIDVEGEGDPVALAEARTRNFHNHKILKCSTPTLADFSRIDKAVKQGDMCVYLVPCPFCQVKQRLMWAGVRWNKEEQDIQKRMASVHYECAECKAVIEERHKTWMLEHGEWRATNPNHAEGVRSFLLSSLYSPLGWYSWKQAVRAFEESKNDPEQLRAFVNTVLGETWKDQAEVPNIDRLWARREKYKIGTAPLRALVLTAGVDVQKDRLVVEIVGWGRGLESWSVDWITLPGLVTDAAVWKMLDDLIDRPWPHAGGGTLPLRMTAIDSGYETQIVYTWARRHSPSRVVAIRGYDNLPMVVGQPSAVEVSEGGKKRQRGLRVWPVGGGLIKSQLYAWLRMELAAGENVPCPAGYIHFPEYELEYFEQLTCERMISRTIGKHRRRTVTYWEKTRPRNEALDDRVYARAAATIAGVDRYGERQWRELEVALNVAPHPSAAQDATQPQAAPPPEDDEDKPRGGGWVGRWRTR